MNSDKVIVTKRCLENILAEVLLLLMIPYIIFMFRSEPDILKWIWGCCLIYLLFLMPFMLAIINEKIIVSDDGITHVLLTKKVKTYSWGDVSKVVMENYGRSYNNMVVIEFNDRKKIKIPFYLPGCDAAYDFLCKRGILGMFSDSPLYYYANMERKSKFLFENSKTIQRFDNAETDISDVIDKVKIGDFLPAAEILNQKTNIGMFEAFLYIRQMKGKV